MRRLLWIWLLLGCVPDRDFEDLPSGALGDDVAILEDGAAPDGPIAELDATVADGPRADAAPDAGVQVDGEVRDGTTPPDAAVDAAPADAAVDLDRGAPDVADPDALEPDAADPDVAPIPDAAPDIQPDAAPLPPFEFADGGSCPRPPRPPDGPRRPVASHPSAAAAPGQSIELNGGFSQGDGHNVDPDFFDWQLVARPAGSQSAIIDADQPIAQLPVDVVGVYRIRLVVGLEGRRSEPFEFDVRCVDQISVEINEERTTSSPQEMLLLNGGTFTVNVNEEFRMGEQVVEDLRIDSENAQVDPNLRGRSTSNFTFGITPRWSVGWPTDMRPGDTLFYDLTLTGDTTGTTDTFNLAFPIRRPPPRVDHAPILDEVIMPDRLVAGQPALLQVRARGYAVAPRYVLVKFGGVPKPALCQFWVLERGGGFRSYAALDDGTQGDLVAGDGIYTLELNPDFNGQPECDFEYAVQAVGCEGRESNIITGRISGLGDP